MLLGVTLSLQIRTENFLSVSVYDGLLLADPGNQLFCIYDLSGIISHTGWPLEIFGDFDVIM